MNRPKKETTVARYPANNQRTRSAFKRRTGKTYRTNLAQPLRGGIRL